MSKIFFSLFSKTNLSAFRNAILANDINRICRILDVHHQHLCKAIDHHGNNPLLFAIQHASLLTCRVLLEQGAQPDQVNLLTYQTPLNLLVSQDSHTNSKHIDEMASLLLDHGAYIEKTSPFSYQDEHGKEFTILETPLMTAVRLKNQHLTRFFLEKKANVNYSDKQTEYRPVHFAIANGDVEMFDLLTDAGASCRSIVTHGKDTLLHWFCTIKSNDQQIPLLKKILHQKCDINAENSHHQTPLMLAAQFNMLNTCHFLLNAGADASKKDSQGHRAVDFAKTECRKLFRDIQSGKKAIHPARSHSKPRESILYSYDLSNHKLPSSHPDPDESDTKYKRMWEKLLDTKEKIRGVPSNPKNTSIVVKL